MSSTSRAWIVAASLATVEAMKDQGFSRWNYTIRSLHQHAKNNMRSVSQSKKLSSPSSAAVVSSKIREVQSQKAKQSEESLRTVMYLSCEKLSSSSSAMVSSNKVREAEEARESLFF
ncbi:hypothetical protein JRO89_XS01G0163100 [Xanthoceras sorbifolium]|uniref:Wound-responsive family protein n=1 Tax=Xanthoceras sorbifolium TaxID=99658 RepID=A0ABQ8IJM4_9ROSI|nr:hypothetical protein JRO89_XS01G0163100 [Xanthoceras sorbifolium]